MNPKDLYQYELKERDVLKLDDKSLGTAIFTVVFALMAASSFTRNTSVDGAVGVLFLGLAFCCAIIFGTNSETEYVLVKPERDDE